MLHPFLLIKHTYFGVYGHLLLRCEDATVKLLHIRLRKISSNVGILHRDYTEDVANGRGLTVRARGRVPVLHVISSDTK